MNIAREYRWTGLFLAIMLTLGILLTAVTYQAVTTLARARVVDALKNPTQDLALHAASIRGMGEDVESTYELLAQFAGDLDIAAIAFYDGTQTSPSVIVGNRTSESPKVSAQDEPSVSGSEEITGVQYIGADGRISTFPTLRVVVPTSSGRVELYRDISYYVDQQVGQFRRSALGAVAAIVGVFILGLIAVFIGIDRRFTKDRKELVRQNAELSDADAAKDRMLATVSHELLTPLTSIISFTDILIRKLKDRLTAQEVEFFEVARRNEQRLKHLIEDLIDLSGVTTGRIGIMPESVEITEYLRTALRHIKLDNAIEGREIRLESDIDPVTVEADPLRLTQVILNLVINSDKYSPAGTPIDLAVSASEKMVTISVQDKGYGVPENDADRVFEPFFRTNQPHVRSQQGIGVGLALSRRIIELHGGEIGVRSRSGGGSVFWFTLPIAARG